VLSRVLNHDVPCKYCYKSVCPEGHHDCLRLVPPEAVVAAALELLRAGDHGHGLRAPLAFDQTQPPLPPTGLLVGRS
jgi:hypothetical protein